MNSACPCCEGREWNTRWPGFVICRSCGLMTVAQDFDLATLKSYYGADYFLGAEYADYLGDRAVHEKTLAGHLRRLRRYVATGGRVLEIGCAHGFFLEMIQPIYPGSMGIDISEAAVAHARLRGMDVRAGDLLETEFNTSFDAVCLWDTIEHLSRPYEVMRRAATLLKPGGFLFLTTGDFGAWLPRWQGLKWRQIHPPTHLFYFTRPSLRKLCNRAGLEPVRFDTVTVHRRLRSALQALERLQGGSPSGRLARVGLGLLPAAVLGWGIPLNLLDTLCLVARKPTREKTD
ncbi:MAG: class I SAM-dependent methyltransferase [Verrucomicrobiia bacterium]